MSTDITVEMDHTGEKKCRKCGEWKTLDQYPKDHRNAGGLHRLCKDCKSALERASYAKNRSRERARTSAKQRRHPEKARVRSSRYIARSRIRDGYRAKWRNFNKKFKARGYKDIPFEDYMSVINSRSERCAYHGDIVPGGVGVDHVVALDNGGEHDISNMLPCCQECNSLKSRGAEEDVQCILDNTWFTLRPELRQYTVFSGKPSMLGWKDSRTPPDADASYDKTQPVDVDQLDDN